MFEEMKGMIMNRNKIVNFYKQKQQGDFTLPPVLTDTSQCNRCFTRKLCAFNALAFDEKTNSGETPEYRDYDTHAESMPEKCRDYMKKWINITHLEQAEEQKGGSKPTRVGDLKMIAVSPTQFGF